MTQSRDGAGPDDQLPADCGGFASKPAWCVQSLRDLNEAVRRGRRADDPWRLRQDAEQAASDKAAAARAAEDRTAKAVRARRDLYRNAWENT